MDGKPARVTNCVAKSYIAGCGAERNSDSAVTCKTLEAAQCMAETIAASTLSVVAGILHAALKATEFA